MKKLITGIFLLTSFLAFGQIKKFAVHDDLVLNLGVGFLADLNVYDRTNLAFQFDIVTPTGYTDITDLSDWESYYIYSNYDYSQFRNALIELNVDWSTLSTVSKQVMVRNYVYPSTTPVSELDLLYVQADRDGYKKETMTNLRKAGIVIRRSKTVNSLKYFTYEVDDNEVLFTDEILPDVKLSDL